MQPLINNSSLAGISRVPLIVFAVHVAEVGGDGMAVVKDVVAILHCGNGMQRVELEVRRFAMLQACHVDELGLVLDAQDLAGHGGGAEGRAEREAVQLDGLPGGGHGRCRGEGAPRRSRYLSQQVGPSWHGLSIANDVSGLALSRAGAAPLSPVALVWFCSLCYV